VRGESDQYQLPLNPHTKSDPFSRSSPLLVIPANAGIQLLLLCLVSPTCAANAKPRICPDESAAYHECSAEPTFARASTGRPHQKH